MTNSLETARLVLRPLQLDDAPMYYERVMRDEAVMQPMHFAVHQSVAETERHITQLLEKIERGTHTVWSIFSGSRRPLHRQSRMEPTPHRRCAAGISPGRLTFPKGSAILCGNIGYSVKGSRALTGYYFAQSVWGQGYASEALTTVLDDAFERPDIWRVEAFCRTDNIGSMRVMEKAGMQREALMRMAFASPYSAVPVDSYCYSRVK
jgi:RimJ/RimL family protein N-acetyltransferase